MDIKTANRLMELRKKKGYTQEELADALGISRQAVSKWERAEASPDTDNLIELAKLYNVSLDDLLLSEEDIDDLDEKENKNNKDTVDIGPHGIHVKSSDGDEVHIGLSGIHVVEGKDNKDINIINVHEKGASAKRIAFSIVSLIVTIVYIVLGFKLDIWHPAWILFILIPAISSIVDAIVDKKITHFNYPCLVTALYLYFGCVLDKWHPMWVLFLTIPLFYFVFAPLEKAVILKRNKKDI